MQFTVTHNMVTKFLHLMLIKLSVQ